MKLISDATITDKICKMKQRVCWQASPILTRKIDQTQVVFSDSVPDDSEFSFLVAGDSGAGSHLGYHPQREVAKLMIPHHADCSFMVHTGDVIYLVGASEFYSQNFILPYKELLMGGEHPNNIEFDKMVFKLPILPVPGNHDYYDLPPLVSLLSFLTEPIRILLQSKIDLDIGWHGSRKGNAYAKAFLDYLKKFNYTDELENHLDLHYIGQSDSGRCLLYEPGIFTRLPNRYYTFRRGGIDFFALDSCTFNDPFPLPKTKKGDDYRQLLIRRQKNLEQQKEQILEKLVKLNSNQNKDIEHSDDLKTQVSQIEEITIDIKKQLAANEKNMIDEEQLDWLKQRLIASWQNPSVRGRVLYFHHPPYVTEATKWQQAQTLAVRINLRNVLDDVAQSIGSLHQDRPLVDLVLNGHAHCLEYLQTLNTGHADSKIHWVICGGSGFSLRRQRVEGFDLTETFIKQDDLEPHRQLVAQSHLFVGRNGHGAQKKRPYSCLRIDVQAGCPPTFIIRPLIAERYQREWNYYELQPIKIKP